MNYIITSTNHVITYKINVLTWHIIRERETGREGKIMEEEKAATTVQCFKTSSVDYSSIVFQVLIY